MSRVRENRMHGSMGGSWKRNKPWQPIHGGPRETEGPEPGPTYSPSPRQLPTRPTSHPTVAELAADLEVGAERVSEILRHAAEPLSLSGPLGEDSDAELADVVEDRSAVSPFAAAAAALLSGEVNNMLITLDERERQILRLRFGLDRGHPRTLDEVGEHFSLTRERIRQIETRAMSKLRHPSTCRAPGVGLDDQQ